MFLIISTNQDEENVNHQLIVSLYYDVKGLILSNDGGAHHYDIFVMHCSAFIELLYDSRMILNDGWEQDRSSHNKKNKVCGFNDVKTARSNLKTLIRRSCNYLNSSGQQSFRKFSFTDP